MRMPQIALQKTLCLFGVIFCHALLPFDGTNPFWKLNAAEQLPLAAVVDSFFGLVLVPSFIFASGFLWALGCERHQRTALQQIKNRAKRLLLPWLAMAVFWMAPLYTLFDLPVFNRPEGTPFFDTLGFALSGVFVDHLWFLLVLFWANVFWIAATPWLGKGKIVQGAICALLVALCIESYGKGLRWYCLWETATPILSFYLGCVVCWHRETVDRFLFRQPLLSLAVLFVLVALLVPYSTSGAPAYWLGSLAACIFSYQLSQILVVTVYPSLQTLRWYRYFEDNAFRYYLFHMPTGLVSFVLINALFPLPPVPFVLLSFTLTMAVTTVFVALSHLLEKRLQGVLAW